MNSTNKQFVHLCRYIVLYVYCCYCYSDQQSVCPTCCPVALTVSPTVQTVHHTIVKPIAATAYWHWYCFVVTQFYVTSWTVNVHWQTAAWYSVLSLIMTGPVCTAVALYMLQYTLLPMLFCKIQIYQHCWFHQTVQIPSLFFFTHWCTVFEKMASFYGDTKNKIQY